ncbi:MAG: hypothetical protein NTZ49_03000 [Candidatus Parcubacteria bacterium]|nr:hypothetical protein [Candidatus Parcubacteria bacterium]
MNMNKVGFFGAIIGGLIGLVSGIGVPIILRYSPQNLVWLVMGIMAATILIILFMMIAFLFSKSTVRKFAGIVLILPIILTAYFSIIIYQQLAPANAPYMDIVKDIDIFKMLDLFAVGMPILMVIVMLPLIIWAFKFMYDTYIKREEILKNGIACQAKILKIVDNGMRVNGQPVYNIALEITSPSQGIYQVTKDFMVPHMDLGLMQPGTIVNVKVDQNNPNNVVFDTWTGNIS